MGLNILTGLSTTTGILNLTTLKYDSDYWEWTSPSYVPNKTRKDYHVESIGTDILPLINGLNVNGATYDFQLTNGSIIQLRRDGITAHIRLLPSTGGYTDIELIPNYWNTAAYGKVVFAYITCAIDPDSHRAFIGSILQYVSGYVTHQRDFKVGSYYPIDSWGPIAYNTVVGAEPFISSYVPVANLWSTNGNTPLTMVRQEYVNGGAYITGLTADNFTRFTTQSGIKQRFIQMNDGETQLLYYCASNPVYITRLDYQRGAGVGTYYKFALSYSIGGQPTFHTQTVEYSAEGSGDVDFWFAFLVDKEHYYAQPSITAYDTYSNTYSINEGHTEDTELLTKYYQWLASYGDEATKPNPFEDNPQNNDPSGGTDFNEKIDEPNGFNTLPTLTGLETNLFKIYNPTLAQLNSFAEFLWSDDFLDTVKKLFGDPIGTVMGVSIIPVAPHCADLPEYIKCGNVTSNVSSNVVDQRFVIYDMGEITIQPTTDSYLDFAPNTKIEIYLPFCGTHQLDVDDVMQHNVSGKAKPEVSATLSLRYIFDVLTGATIAQLAVNGSVHYQFTGSCSGEIPINSQTYDNMLNAILTTSTTLATAVATQGATAPMLAGTIATNINAMKPTVHKSGNISSVLGMMSLNYPYITITQPIVAYSKGEHVYKGYPSYMTRRLSQCSGYTKVFDCHVEGMSCSEEEKSMLLSLLKGGVIL